MMPIHEDIEKAARGERARIERLIAAQEARVRRAFRRFLDDVRSEAVRRQVRIALEHDGVDAALRVVDAHVLRMGTVLVQVFQAAGIAEVATLGRQLGRAAAAINPNVAGAAALGRQLAQASVAVSFDPSYPRAAQIMRQNSLEFVREFTTAQRESTRAALAEALQSGAGPIQTARAFRDSIGLTEYQRQVVANYRRALEMGDASALTRDLRDRRFDSSVRRLLEEGEPLGPKRIARMVEQYRNRYLQLRGETIARTETLHTVNVARDEALRQVTEKVNIPANAVTRTWRATGDSRTRDTHAAMNGQKRQQGQPFTSPSGARLMFPGDRSLDAPASELINCRCVLINSIKV